MELKWRGTMKTMSLTILIMVMSFFATTVLFTGCTTDADVASHNISKDAEQFKINRRIVFYNSITDTYMLSIEGRCSVDFFTDKFTVTCKTGPNEYKKHYLGRSDNTLPFVEQIEGADVSTYRYKVIFKPTAIIPDVDMPMGNSG